MIATLIYEAPASYATDASQIAAFSTAAIYSDVNALLGLPTPPGAGVTDTVVMTTDASKTVRRTISYDLADPALAVFTARFSTAAAQIAALASLFKSSLAGLTGSEVTAKPVVIA